MKGERALVEDGNSKGDSFWQQVLQQQVHLGDETFVLRIQQRATPRRLAASEISKSQRQLP